MDQPTVLYILYTMVSAQQTNLLPKNALRNDAIFAQNVYRIYATTSQYLSSCGCTITMVYIYITSTDYHHTVQVGRVQVQYLHQCLDEKAPPVQVAEGDATTCASGLSALVAEWKSTTSTSCNW